VTFYQITLTELKNNTFNVILHFSFFFVSFKLIHTLEHTTIVLHKGFGNPKCFIGFLYGVVYLFFYLICMIKIAV
jgi:hypothetical protein